MPLISSTRVRLWGIPALVFCLLLPPLPGRANDPGPDQELRVIRQTGNAFVRISRNVTPSVVNIKTYRKVTSRRSDLYDQFMGEMFEPFREFFGRDFGRRYPGPQDQQIVQTGLGSGVIVKREGIVLTNNHVVEGAHEIRVTLNDRKEVTADVVGSDPRTDIAVLRLPEGDYPFASMGDSDGIEVGEWVVAIGNPFGLGQSVTVGVVSAKGRADVGVADLEDFIQTDAAINPGNSGGPLIDLEGEVIGINTAIFSRSGGYQGIGFAIPSNMASTIMENLLRTGRVVRSDLGFRVQEATEAILEAIGAGTAGGVLVNEVMGGGGGEKSGVRRGDLITRIKGREVRNVDSYYRITSVLAVGEKVPVTVIRDGIPNTFMVTAGELPPRPRDSGVRLRTALGFSVEDLTEELAERLGFRYERGVLVTRVARTGPADKAGVEPGDLILRINGKPTPDLEAFRLAFEAVEWGDQVHLSLSREGRERTVILSLVQP